MLCGVLNRALVDPKAKNQRCVNGSQFELNIKIGVFVYYSREYSEFNIFGGAACGKYSCKLH